MPIFDVSGDGRRLIYDVAEEPRGDIWLLEAKTGHY
jgi:hypothetical protein